MLRQESRSTLPVKLAKEPLVDAIFEMRFDSPFPVASIWPGILYGALSGEKTLENLPAVGIPKDIRDQDENLTFVPLCRISVNGYWVIIGDRVFAVAAQVPYQGWTSFKQAIVSAFDVVLSSGFIASISRCSIKYVDILDGVPFEPTRCFDMDMTLGGRSPKPGEDFHIRIGFEEAGVKHTLQIASNANAVIFGGKAVSGPVLDVDSVLDLPGENPEEFKDKLAERAQLLHDLNKQVVFDCLSTDALQFLEPSYE